jgi:hypothetical protein
VGDFVTTRNGQDVFLVETVRGRSVAELTMDAIVAAGIPTYAHKSSVKKAAQRMNRTRARRPLGGTGRGAAIRAAISPARASP